MSFKKLILPAFIITAFIAAISLTPARIESIEKIYSGQVKYPSVFPVTEEDKLWIENKLKLMSIREKCAQLIMPAVYRSDFDLYTSGFSHLASLVQNEKIGGLILFQCRLEDEIKFINRMQELSEIPLLISSDFERGPGTRIDNALEFPHAMALGSTFNADYAFELGKITALESRNIGVHQNFAPVADINNNPMNPVINIRSFSENKDEVIKFVKAFIEGSNATRFITTAKHFPGHGNTEIDSHYDLPVINGSEEDLSGNELEPFKEAVKSGVQSIMVGHLEVPAFELIKGIPSSLSKSIVTYLLKEELGFDGLIVTDAMNMEAITKYYSGEDAAVMAIEAGCDIILMPPEEIKAIDALENAVSAGRISMERLDESVRKILAAKRWLGIDEQRIISLPVNNTDDNPYQQIAKKIAEESITLLKNDDNLIPVNPNKYKNICCITLTDKNWSERTEYFENLLEKRLGKITAYFFTGKTKRKEYSLALNELTESDLIIISSFIDVKTYRGPVDLSAEQIDFIAGVLRKKIPVVLISFRNPYLIYLFPEAGTYLNSFSHSYPSQDAMLRAILGETDIKGKLPVTVPESNLVFGGGIELQKSLNTAIRYDLLNNELTKSIDAEMTAAVNEKLFPGGVILAAKDGKIFYHKASGKTGFLKDSSELEKNEVFNLGRLTSLFTIASALKLADEDKLNPEDELFKYFDGFYEPEKRKIRIKELITHTSGIGTNVYDLKSYWQKDDLLYRIKNQELSFAPESKSKYSSLNIILLQEIIERKSDEKLSSIYENNFQKPLVITNSGYSNSGGDFVTILYDTPPAPLATVISQDELLQNIMESDYGGTSGFDGFYSDANDLAVFAQMLLQEGYYNGKQILNASTVENWLNGFVENDGVNFAGGKIEVIDPGGTSISISSDSNSFLIILTNANINNPANDSFAEFSKKIIRFFNEEISRGLL